MSEQTATADPETQRLRQAFIATVSFAALLWAIKLLELAAGIDLSMYGIYPRRPEALTGILLAPLLHGSVAHLFANTLPLLVLGTASLYGYPRAARIALPLIYIGAGAGVWLFARPAYHIGASGLTFGMMFFIFTMGVLRWDRRAIALSMVVFFLYGGMVWGIFPSGPGISFEYHFFGAALGVLLAVILRRSDPPPPEKKYAWEYEDDTDDWPDPPGPDRSGTDQYATGRSIMGNDTFRRCGLVPRIGMTRPVSGSRRPNHSPASPQNVLAVLTVAMVLLAGCGSTPTGEPRCDGNNFEEVTLKPGCSAICVQEPCGVLFEMPAGSGTLPVRVGNLPLGDFPAGERVFLGSFFVGGYVFYVEQTDMPPAYLTVGTSSAQ